LSAPLVDAHRVKQIIAAVYERSPHGRTLASTGLGDDETLFSLEPDEPSLGLDSLDAVEIATELEEAFDVVMPAEIDPAELRTVRQVVEMLERLLREQRGGES
jgi:acyl carrier protein